uniref:Uncharacterized protein n=2 Tax=Magnoliopsida TaxID=3398 RepID=A0A822YI28_NELNU|nr:TPA_asm: hypothetical protein HUJ06_010973 [Nelumbo nucifera]
MRLFDGWRTFRRIPYEEWTAILRIPYDEWKAILRIQKFRRIVSYTGFYCFVSLLSYAYTNNTTRAGISRGDQFYASFPAGTELLTDTAKVYDFSFIFHIYGVSGPPYMQPMDINFALSCSCIKLRLVIVLKRRNGAQLNLPSWLNTLIAKERHLMLTTLNTWRIFFLMGSLMEVASGGEVPIIHCTHVKILWQ